MSAVSCEAFVLGLSLPLRRSGVGRSVPVAAASSLTRTSDVPCNARTEGEARAYVHGLRPSCFELRASSFVTSYDLRVTVRASAYSIGQCLLVTVELYTLYFIDRT